MRSASATVTAIAREAGDPLRAALRAAIEAEKAARDALAERRDAVARAKAHAAACETGLLNARAAVATLREKQAERLAAGLARGGAAATSPSGELRQARAAERDVEDDRDAAVAAVQRLEGELSEEGVQLAQSEISLALNTVLAGAATGIITEMRIAKRRYLLGQAALVSIIGQRREDDPTFGDPLARHRVREAVNAPLEEARAAASLLLATNLTIDENELAARQEVEQKWRAFRQALRADPDAPAPASGGDAG